MEFFKQFPVVRCGIVYNPKLNCNVIAIFSRRDWQNIRTNICFDKFKGNLKAWRLFRTCKLPNKKKTLYASLKLLMAKMIRDRNEKEYKIR